MSRSSARHRAYSDARADDYQPTHASVEHDLPYGEWVRLLVENGFRVESLIEIRPPEDAESTYRNADETAWARRWPMEEVWRARRT